MEDEVKEILAEALRFSDPAQRSAWLAGACAGNDELRRELESLLKAYGDAGDFFDRALPLTPSAEHGECPGARIGPYRLIELIGEGGFGTVWMVEQQEPVRRRVALKIIKLGMDTREVVARFEAERQALAIMDHPNIAKVFDGGATESGRPYFVMELVKGTPITQFCDLNKLSMEQRLDLFTRVCHAVHHAHQKGIIHRDLKPSNILVTQGDDGPVPKVIDFGVAKATQARLTDKTLFTHRHQWLGTPAYMSPEQAGLGGLDVDTRSDVYSLGVLLYELLTGHTPFETEELLAAGWDALMRIIREEDPLKPSTRLSMLSEVESRTVASRRGVLPGRLGKQVRGELEWIVMKALEKDRQRRYDSALSLASDIQRHLRSEPVSAAAPNLGYRARKFARRNSRRLVLASLALAMVGIASFGAKLAWRSRAERAVLSRAGTNVIFAAVTSRDSATVRRLLEINPQLVYQTNASGATPLMAAAAAGQSEAIRMLLARGAALNAIDRSASTALSAAAFNGQTAAAKVLLDAGASLNATNQNGFTALTFASRNGAREVVRALLDRGANAEVASVPEGRTPLHFAAWMGHDEIVALLLDRGAKPSPSDVGGLTPLHLAAAPPAATWERLAELTEESAKRSRPLSNLMIQAVSAFREQTPAAGTGHRRVAELLLAHGANARATTVPGGATPLMLAALCTNPAVAEVLIDSKIGLNDQDPLGATALNMAAATGAEGIVACLLAAGADPNLPDRLGFTPLNTAAENGCVKVAETLLANGADPDLAATPLRAPGRGDFSGQTPLHSAAARGHVEMIRLLLDKGVPPDKPSPAGTPLAVAVIGGHKAAAELLLDRGANVNLPTGEQGTTPLYFAALLGHPDLVRLLLQRGASNSVVSRLGTPLHAAAGGVDPAARLLVAGAAMRAEHTRTMPPNLGSAREYREALKLLIASGAELNAPEPQYQRTPLFVAVNEGQAGAVQELISAGASLAWRDSARRTVLYAACESKAGTAALSNIVVLLLKAGADPNIRQEQGATPLHAAAMYGRPELAALLLQAGGELDARGPHDTTPLHLAVAHGRLEAVQFLLNRGADPGPTNSFGRTALHDATDTRATKIMDLLLTHGAPVDAIYPDGTTPLLHSAVLGDTNGMRLLLKHGANVHATRSDGYGALDAAVQEGQVESVKLLLEGGARLDGHDGRVPLVEAAGYGRLNIVKLLLDRGASLRATNPSQVTALSMAADHGRPEVVEYLLDRGADVQTRATNDLTALHYAAHAYFTNRAQYVAVARALLKHGADVNARARLERTPLHEAAIFGSPGVLDVLLEAKADPNLRDAEGYTALDWARKRGHTDCVNLLQPVTTVQPSRPP